MKCLRCVTVEMEILTRQEGDEPYEVDICSGCGGIWLDAKELSRMDDNFFVNMEDIPYRDVAPSKNDAQLHCPRCEGRPMLNKVSPKDHGNVVLDTCPSCKGFWLDSGEFKKVSEISTDITVAALFADE